MTWQWTTIICTTIVCMFGWASMLMWIGSRHVDEVDYDKEYRLKDDG